MCTDACLDFTQRSLPPEQIVGRRIVEVGSYDVNGGVRRIVECHDPAEYVGVDIVKGPGVDIICPAANLAEIFGVMTFDILITTEMMEHVPDWREAINGMKMAVRQGGLLLLTTRSRGFHFHGYPGDFWRFEPDDLRHIFADFDIISLERDTPDAPGVFMLAMRRDTNPPIPLDDIDLYSIIRHRRTRKLTNADKFVSRGMTVIKTTVQRTTPERARKAIRSLIGRPTARSTAP